MSDRLLLVGGREIWEDFGFGIWIGYYGISRLLTEKRGEDVIILGLQFMSEPNTSSWDVKKGIYMHLHINSNLYVLHQC